MGSEHIAVIAPAVREVLAADDAAELWATFEVRGDADRFIQLTRGSINMAYPSSDDPAGIPERLGLARPGALVLSEWEAGVFATFEVHRELTAEELSRLVDQLFEDVLGCSGADYRSSYSLAVRIESFASG